jgi:hypothetical protein
VLDVTARPTRSIPILLYHSVSDDPSSEAAPFAVTPTPSAASSPTSASRATRASRSPSWSGPWARGRRCPTGWCW